MKTMMNEIWQRPEIITHTQRLLESYRHWLGKEMIPREGSAAEQARALFEAPIIVVSDGTEVEPVFNYGNAAALKLFELDWERFTRLPSRQSAEVVHQAERDRLREQVNSRGFMDNYSGIRISASGRRFRIERAIVWVVRDEKGKVIGKAAGFWEWGYV